LSETLANGSPVDLRPLTRQLGGRWDDGQPVRHDLTCTCRTVAHQGTRPLTRFCPLEALRQRHPAHRLGCPSAWRLAAKHVLATPCTPQSRTSGRTSHAGARQELTRHGDRCVQITTLEVIHVNYEQRQKRQHSSPSPSLTQECLVDARWRAGPLTGTSAAPSLRVVPRRGIPPLGASPSGAVQGK